MFTRKHTHLLCAALLIVSVNSDAKKTESRYRLVSFNLRAPVEERKEDSYENYAKCLKARDQFLYYRQGVKRGATCKQE